MHLKDKRSYISYAVMIIMAAAYLISVAHTDAQVISLWAKSFLDCIHAGNIRNFAAFCAESSLADNYTILFTMATAVWVLPVYLIELIIGQTVSIYIYILWLKILVCAAGMCSGYLMYRIMESYDVDPEKKRYMLIMYYLSGAVMHGCIGVGQVDIFSAVCLMQAFLSYRKKRYDRMALMGALILIIKPVGILFYLPMLLLSLSDDIPQLIRYAVIILVPDIIDRVLERTFFIDYNLYRAAVNHDWNHIDKFFDGRTEGVALFLAIYGAVLIMCIIRAWEHKEREHDILMYEGIIAIAFLSFTIWSPWWGVYAQWILIVICALLPMDREGPAFALALSMAYWVYVIFAFAHSNDNAMFVCGFLNMFFQKDYMLDSINSCVAAAFPLLAPYLGVIGRTMIFGIGLCMLYRFRQVLTAGKVRVKSDNDRIWSVSFIVIMAVLDIMYLVSVYYTIMISPLR